MTAEAALPTSGHRASARRQVEIISIDIVEQEATLTFTQTGSAESPRILMSGGEGYLRPTATGGLQSARWPRHASPDHRPACGGLRHRHPAVAGSRRTSSPPMAWRPSSSPAILYRMPVSRGWKPSAYVVRDFSTYSARSLMSASAPASSPSARPDSHRRWLWLPQCRGRSHVSASCGPWTGRRVTSSSPGSPPRLRRSMGPAPSPSRPGRRACVGTGRCSSVGAACSAATWAPSGVCCRGAWARRVGARPHGGHPWRWR